MTEAEIRRVRAGWDRVAGSADGLTRAFYGHLFEAHPEVRPLFRGDLSVQREKLAAALDAILRALGDPETLLALARDLARRHVAYGVEAHHYGAVGQALIAALEEVLGAEFTPADAAAWGSIYSDLAVEMILAARGAA